MLIYNELQSHPEISSKQLQFFWIKCVLFAYRLLIAFCSCENIEVFENIYKNFVPVKDYDSRCFKIVNEHYLKYVDAKEQYFLEHTRERKILMRKNLI